jgi:hypothetical protein
MTDLEKEAIEMVSELLKYGAHDGPCDNTYTDEDGEVCDCACSLHLSASAERKKKAEDFLIRVQKSKDLASVDDGSLSAYDSLRCDPLKYAISKLKKLGEDTETQLAKLDTSNPAYESHKKHIYEQIVICLQARIMLGDESL